MSINRFIFRYEFKVFKFLVTAFVCFTLHYLLCWLKLNKFSYFSTARFNESYLCGNIAIQQQLIDASFKTNSTVTLNLNNSLCTLFRHRIATYPTYKPVDIRFIVLTFNRPSSLHKCLDSLRHVVLDGHIGSIDIWIDRYPNGSIDEAVKAIAEDFRWPLGDVHVHVHNNHVGIYGQWIDSWRPQLNSKELAIFLEDDIDVSPWIYRWLKTVHYRYDSKQNIAGYCLQDSPVFRAAKWDSLGSLLTQRKGPVSLHRVIGTWGFVPVPRYWRQFQDWFHLIRISRPHFHPYVIRAPMFTGWYMSYERANFSYSMWSMWFLFFTDAMKLFTLFPNLPTYTGKVNTSLLVNRREKGLHFSKESVNEHVNLSDYLMTSWSDDFAVLPVNPIKYDYDGQILL